MKNFNKIKKQHQEKQSFNKIRQEKINLQQKSTREKKISTRFDRIKAKNRQLSTQKIKNGSGLKDFYDNLRQL